MCVALLVICMLLRYMKWVYLCPAISLTLFVLLCFSLGLCVELCPNSRSFLTGGGAVDYDWSVTICMYACVCVGALACVHAKALARDPLLSSLLSCCDINHSIFKLSSSASAPFLFHLSTPLFLFLLVLSSASTAFHLLVPSNSKVLDTLISQLTLFD